jgi:hypothetical protein
MTTRLSPEALAKFGKPRRNEWADAEALHATAEAHQGRLRGMARDESRRLSTGARKSPARRREKMFGLGRPRALDRNAKARIAHLANCLMRRTEPGRHYGQVTAPSAEGNDRPRDWRSALSGRVYWGISRRASIRI